MQLAWFALRFGAKILSVLLFITTILAAYGGHVNPYIWGLPSIITLAFPYLAIVTLIVSVVWIVMRKFIIGGIGIFVLFVCWGSVMTVSPLSSSKSAEPGEKELSLLTYNIMQGDDWQHPDSKDNRTFRYILNSGADIVCLQEYCGSLKNIPAMSDELADSISLIYPYAASYKENELGIISKYPVSRVAAPVLAGETVDDHSFAIFKVQIGREALYVVNVHLASYMLNNTERNVVTNIHSVGTAKRSLGEFKGSIMQKMKASFRFRADESGIVRGVIDSLPGNVIVCGDFNDVPLSWAYRTIRGSDVKDAYVETGFGPIVTYNKHRFLFHIDQILYRGELRPLSVERGSLKSSDHYPVKATFAY